MQLTLYLDKDTQLLAKAAAAADGVSLSRWVASTIQDATQVKWPKVVLDAAGAFPDWPLVEPDNTPDVPRETLG